ncbi:MAG TPA: LysR substrate-binding domain-containing protein [Caulobacter sp.]|nr:LysR substrate-binding domain-containing protein [Caulobacter sp.]
MAMSLRLPSLETLRIFEACARHGNFSRAAVELCITPAAVSQRVRGLELELGRTLFVRKGPRIALSAEGQTLFGRTSQMMAIARAAIEELRGSRALRLTATPSFASRWLAVHVPDFEALHPGVQIDIDVSADVRDLNTFDIAIRSGRGDWSSVRTTPLFPVEGTPMLRPDLLERCAIIEPGDLARVPLIPNSDWPRWFDEQGLDRPDLTAARRLAFPSQDLAAQAALEGKGAALLSPKLFAAEIANGRLARPFPFVLSGPEQYWLVEPEREAGPTASAFRNWLLTTLASA